MIGEYASVSVCYITTQTRGDFKKTTNHGEVGKAFAHRVEPRNYKTVNKNMDTRV